MSRSVAIFGAGKIGRSFLGVVFSRAGLRITFVDAVPEIVDGLNSSGGYCVVQLSPDGRHRRDRVGGVDAIHASDVDSVRALVHRASIICTAVGMRAFPPVIEQIARGLGEQEPAHNTRGAAHDEPKNLILAENIHGAGDMAREILTRHGVAVVPGAGGIGIIETSIGKMVPTASPPGLTLSSPLDVTAEAYNTLIVDRKNWAGPFPRITGLHGVDNIRAYVDRKLFIHNFGHAAAAYLGAEAQPAARYIAEALESQPVLDHVRLVMLRSAAALAAEYPDDLAPPELRDHVDDLIARFRNPYLYDTVVRVGRDLQRKLDRDDRVVGALRLMARHGVDLAPAVQVYLAALRFDPAAAQPQEAAAGTREELPPEDRTLQDDYRAHGLSFVLEHYSGLGPESVGADAAARTAILEAAE